MRRDVLSASLRGTLRARLVRGGIGSLVIRCLYMGLELATAVVLARQLGAHEFGVYAVIYALIRMLALPAQAGLPTLVVRETAAYMAVGKFGLLKGLMLRSNQAVTAFSLLIGGIVLAAAFLLGRDSSVLSTLLWALILLPFMALGNLRGAMLRGLQKVVQGQLPESVFRPALLLVFLTIFALSKEDEVSAASAMALHAIAAIISFVLGAWLLWRCLPSYVVQSLPEYATRRWIISALPLSLFSGLQVLNNQIGVLILGAYSSTEDAGVFRVVSQLGFFVGFMLTSVNMVIAPHVARLWATGSTEQLQKIATWSARAIAVSTLILGALLIVLGEPLLGFAFGVEFERGSRALVVLSLGQIICSFTGAAMIFLNMSGRESLATKSVVLATFANVALSLTLVPLFGLEGAALASAVSFILLNLVAASHVKRSIKINPYLA